MTILARLVVIRAKSITARVSVCGSKISRKVVAGFPTNERRPFFLKGTFRAERPAAGIYDRVATASFQALHLFSLIRAISMLGMWIEFVIGRRNARRSRPPERLPHKGARLSFAIIRPSFAGHCSLFLHAPPYFCRTSCHRCSF